MPCRLTNHARPEHRVAGAGRRPARGRQPLLGAHRAAQRAAHHEVPGGRGAGSGGWMQNMVVDCSCCRRLGVAGARWEGRQRSPPPFAHLGGVPASPAGTHRNHANPTHSHLSFSSRCRSASPAAARPLPSVMSPSASPAARAYPSRSWVTPCAAGGGNWRQIACLAGRHDAHTCHDRSRIAPPPPQPTSQPFPRPPCAGRSCWTGHLRAMPTPLPPWGPRPAAAQSPPA